MMLTRTLRDVAQNLAGGVLMLSWLIIPAIAMWSRNP